MPIYEYRRPDGTTFEIQQSFSDDALTADPDTGVPVERVLHAPAVHFKGKGFYNTDYGTRNRQRETAAAAAEKRPRRRRSSKDSSRSPPRRWLVIERRLLLGLVLAQKARERQEAREAGGQGQGVRATQARLSRPGAEPARRLSRS